ncbi:MAG: glycosyltransferase family 2 protein [Paludibacteraceae bacterium]|nr:glycosyltransferase family 2 protein [Paludibacteraceae bacterium]
MVSIVIPLYNKEKAIVRTLDSVLAQTYTDYEVIVVNDGSTDNSKQVVEEYIQLSIINSQNGDKSSIRLINQSNGGVCSARNRGIQEAQGEYIAFLDADDLWDKDYLAEQVRMMSDFPKAAMWGINFAEMYDGKLVRELPTGLQKGYRGYVEDYFNIPGRISDLFCSSSVVIHKEVFDKVGYFDERIKYAEDTDMWWRIIARYPVAFYDRYMVFYQFDAENRALQRTRKFKFFLPCYPDKYKPFKDNVSFYRYTQRWCAQRIKIAYFGTDDEDRQYATKAKDMVDIKVLPLKYILFFKLPYSIAKWLHNLDLKRLHKA